MSNVNAGIGRAQLESLNKIVIKKREINAFYYKHLNHIEGLSIMTENSSDYYSNHWLTNLAIEPEKLKFSINQLKTKLLENLIHTRFLWKPLHLQSAYNQSTYFGDKNAEYLFQNGLSLPSSYDITKKEEHLVVEIILSLT
jgi:dTDP-4-amino-4,6-dideoxygalactose transaminase